ncbi:phage tail protein [Roseibium litorale]|uniref:Phage tail protein n=1 Tax=Roseibium litorale TaxID=2803841 RepID=A0ABR9CKJ7_9HYPH|nr:tail fiber protein [Roseibium litorale]MBD8890935.1 phage tail protein [Roseibium litorale]
MSEPFLAEIRMVGFDFPPRGWSFTDGQILPINQNQSLYSLLGTTYGGDGRTTFALPDLRGRTPVHRGEGQTLGQKSGAETVTLTVAEMPYHMHYAIAQLSTGNQRNPENHYLSAPSIVGFSTYADYTSMNAVVLKSGTIANTGGSQPHDNMQPYIAVSFCIALQGLFPSRN